VVRHVVIWSMAEGREQELPSLLAAMNELPSQIDAIVDLTVGTLLNDSPMDAALCVDVEDQDALATYRSHPAHQPVLANLRECAAQLVVADYVL
jgi:hypothetical protein